MLYVRFPSSLRNVEDFLHEHGIEISHETIRFWWKRFDPMFAAELRRKRIIRTHSLLNWPWHLDLLILNINGETHYLWRAVDREGEVLDSYVTKRQNSKSALIILRNLIKCYGTSKVIVPDRLRSYDAAMKIIGNADRQAVGRRKNN